MESLSSRSFSSRRVGRQRRVLSEALEPRQLMSLTVEVRNVDGTATATAPAVGHVLNLDVLAIISSSSNQPSGDGLEDFTGSFISTALYGHAVTGNLTAANISPFRANGANAGTPQDLNGDGNIDVGSTSATNTSQYFQIRSSPIQTLASGTGTVDGNDLEFVVGTLNYTVTNLNEGGETSINFAPYVNASSPDAAAWEENGSAVDNTSGTFTAGTPFIVSEPSLVVAPVAVNDTATATKNTPLTINELANDNVVAPLNPASVTVGTAAAHGSTAVQTDGSILYTPAAGYTGADSFTYTVADTDGRVSNAATVSITVVNAPPPDAVADTQTTLKNQAVTINVLANDTDPAGATLTPSSVAIVTAAAHGTAVAQPSGTVLYTPTTGFFGTDTFTYTVADSNDETSSPATVTVTVSLPVPPTVPVFTSETTTSGTPLSINVLALATDTSSTLAPAATVVVSQPSEGSAVAQANGSIVFTPAVGFVGIDSFTYTVGDALGQTSNTGAITLDVTKPPPPSAGDFTAPVLADQGNVINVLGSTTSSGPALVAGSVMVVTQPTNGTATVNPGDGTILYTPAAGFVGSDSFSYTVGDANGDTSNIATVTLGVGTSISNAKGSAHSLSFTDAAGGVETLSLNRGSAQISFTGTGSLTVAKNGKATVTGSGINLAGIVLTGTTAASSLSIRGSVKTPGTLGLISDASPLGSVIAPTIALDTAGGTASFLGVGRLTLGNITDSVLSIGAGLPGKVAITAGAVAGSSLSSAVPITALKIASWTGDKAITAPSIGSLSVAGGFDAALTLSSNSAKAVALASAKIGGAVDGSLTASGASIGSFSAGSAAATWAPAVGNLKSLTIKAGGLASNLSAGVVGTLSIGGNLTSNLTLTSAKAIRVSGAIDGGANLTEITIAQSLGQLVAGSMTDVSVLAGVPGRTTFIVPSGPLTGTIGSIQLTGRTGDVFVNTAILAGKIGSASLGAIATDNSGQAFGIDANSIGSFSGVFATGALHLSRAQLSSEVVLQTYLLKKAVLFGDFNIDIGS